MMEYKGYFGRVEYDDEAQLLHGEVINTRGVITFQGVTVAEVRKAFRDSVDCYLAFCKELGDQPEKPFSGQFVTRVGGDLHRRISLAAALSGKSLNAWVTEQLEKSVQQSCPILPPKSAKEKAVTSAARSSNSRTKTHK